ncbi:branched-chain amino acid ABC transporter permease [Nocardioides zeae]|uniref:Branched-chain amino acid ABC transporter permease n=1 Tax=Nocardioides zeae TaxID=1457234 RepID=A0A6P0HM85_9ACTN|nr:branched-chain amino acid ABC transporter permease [Nocardioides zeae]NEN79733.1 branched-chain amino acid ABC transporter permease [Nocardioides zeae]
MNDWLVLLVGASTNAAIYALIAFSLVLVYRGSRVVNFGVGYLAVFGGIFFANTAGSGWLALLLALGVTAALGLAMYVLAVRLAERAGSTHAALAIGTLGFGLILDFLGGEFWAKQGFSSAPLVSGGHEVGGVMISNQRILTVVLAVVVFVLLRVLIDRTMPGWAMEAVAFRPSTAAIYGINPVVVLAGVWLLAGAIAGLAGVLRTPTSAVSLGLALPLAIQGFAAAVLGGLGSIQGAAIGAVVVAFADALFVRYVSSEFASLFAFLLLFVVIAVRPQGIMGAGREVVRT